MSALEQLRPFVSLCQACGLIPYVMKYDAITDKFVGFTFSFKNGLTWWFFFVALLQCLIPFMMTSMTSVLYNEMSANLKLPFTVLLLSGVNSIGCFVQFAMCRWIGLRYSHWRKVVEAIQNAEKLLGNVSVHENSIKKRIAIGSLLIFTSVPGLLFATGYAARSFLPNAVEIELIPFTFIFSVMASMMTMLVCPFLLMHLSYYIISHYINILHCHMQDHSEMELKPSHITNRGEKQSMEMLSRSAQILNFLCQASHELNCIFSIPILLILTIKLVAVTSNSYFFIYSGIIQSNEVVKSSMVLATPILLLVDWVLILAVLATADMPVYQIHLLRERVTTLRHSGFSNIVAVMFFLKQIQEDRVRLSAAGLFTVGKHLIPAVVGAVVTYLVVLLQN